jgi:hypothetical protein
MSVSWGTFASEAPELAHEVEARFRAHIHHIIGTLRQDGELRIGMMPDAWKLADVRRDPRVEIHSAPLEADLAGGDAKVAGRLREAGAPDDQPGAMFTLDIERVSLVRVDGHELEFTTWRPGRGLRKMRRE